MAERLFGVETEYAIARISGGAEMDREQLLERIHGARSPSSSSSCPT